MPSATGLALTGTKTFSAGVVVLTYALAS